MEFCESISHQEIAYMVLVAARREFKIEPENKAYN